jgi:uncharacterized oxidoreductase
MRLTGKTVLVTGAGTGMGLEAAKQLTALGNRVIMVARKQSAPRDRGRQPARRVTVCL